MARAPRSGPKCRSTMEKTPRCKANCRPTNAPTPRANAIVGRQTRQHRVLTQLSTDKRVRTGVWSFSRRFRSVRTRGLELCRRFWSVRTRGLELCRQFRSVRTGVWSFGRRFWSVGTQDRSVMSWIRRCHRPVGTIGGSRRAVANIPIESGACECGHQPAVEDFAPPGGGAEPPGLDGLALLPPWSRLEPRAVRVSRDWVTSAWNSGKSCSVSSVGSSKIQGSIQPSR